jgi:UDP-N-acetylglucosamine 2-epimerase (non-hydrolysing)
VQGDTTTAFASALAAFYERIPVGHVEAGLRTDDLFDPFPEEANRRLISQIAQLHFAPTARSAANLGASGVVGEIHTTGNTVIDALLLMADTAPEWQLPGLDWHHQRVLLATVHRRENWGSRLGDIGRGFLQLLDRYPDTALLLPLHRNPTVRQPLQALLGDHPRAFLTEPLDYDRLVAAMRGCTLLLTDSGGLQEEAPALGKPVLVLRRTTERPEAVEAGTARLIGTDSEAILAEAGRLLDDRDAYDAMARAHNPFGDGHAAERILAASLAFLDRGGTAAPLTGGSAPSPTVAGR